VKGEAGEVKKIAEEKLRARDPAREKWKGISKTPDVVSSPIPALNFACLEV